SAWPCAGRSSAITAGVSGWTLWPARAAGFASPFPPARIMGVMMADRLGRALDILLVEDDEGDVLITREALAEQQIRGSLHVVHDGDQALQFVHRTGRYSAAPRPDLVLLDLNLPRRGGLEVLAELKSHPSLRLIP